MFDCSNDVLNYHDDEVNLEHEQRTDMRKRRDANRDRLSKGLEKADKPKPKEYKSQGSYAMWVMTQRSGNDYDIDDGVYFDKEQLVGPQGGDMSALDARKMVRDAVDDGSFKTPPEVRNNCVRVFYVEGYHVDLPVYRRVTSENSNGKTEKFNELASTDWKRSDARKVTAWFDEKSQELTTDTIKGGQLRRIVREIKKFATSRASWKDSILSGFGITKLVTEEYRGNSSREDEALHDTMKAIRDRLNSNLIVEHPTTPYETITSGDNDPKAAFLRDKLSDAIRWLEPTFGLDCTRKEALKCWDNVFDSSYFIERRETNEGSSASASSGAFSSGLLKETQSPVSPVNKSGANRYA